VARQARAAQPTKRAIGSIRIGDENLYARRASTRSSIGDRVLAIDTNKFQKSLWNLVDE
jgi:hypothetical protein